MPTAAPPWGAASEAAGGQAPLKSPGLNKPAKGAIVTLRVRLTLNSTGAAAHGHGHVDLGQLTRAVRSCCSRVCSAAGPADMRADCRSRWEGGRHPAPRAPPGRRNCTGMWAHALTPTRVHTCSLLLRAQHVLQGVGDSSPGVSAQTCADGARRHSQKPPPRPRAWPRPCAVLARLQRPVGGAQKRLRGGPQGAPQTRLLPTFSIRFPFLQGFGVSSTWDSINCAETPIYISSAR